MTKEESIKLKIALAIVSRRVDPLDYSVNPFVEEYKFTRNDSLLSGVPEVALYDTAFQSDKENDNYREKVIEVAEGYIHTMITRALEFEDTQKD